MDERVKKKKDEKNVYQASKGQHLLSVDVVLPNWRKNENSNYENKRISYEKLLQARL
jgi:hypothetical protein